VQGRGVVRLLDDEKVVLAEEVDIIFIEPLKKTMRKGT
jgi:hypothetical protein